MKIRGKVTERIPMPNAQQTPRYHADRRLGTERQRRIGRQLDSMSKFGTIERWTWIYTDASTAYYEVEMSDGDILLCDTRTAEAFLLGARCGRRRR